MRTRWERLELRFEIRRSPAAPLAERLSALPPLARVLKNVRKLNRSIGQALAFVREDDPEIAALVVDITMVRGTMTFFCENDSTRYALDQWVRCNRYNIQGVCSKPPQQVRTKCLYRPSE